MTQTHTKTLILNLSSKFVMISIFKIHTVHLKCFGNIRCTCISCLLFEVFCYDSLWSKWVFMINVRTNFNFTYFFILVNFTCELGQVLAKYDFLRARWVICAMFELTPTWHYFFILVNFSCELGQIMTRYDFLLARRVILSNVRINFNLP